LLWRDLGLQILIAPVQILALLRAWSWCRLHRPDPASAAVLATLTTLLVYQVGFPQYQMGLFALVTYWLVRPESPLARNPLLLAGVATYFSWIAIFDAYYCAVGLILRIPGLGLRDIEDIVGLPTFLLGCFLLVGVVRTAARRTSRRDQQMPDSSLVGRQEIEATS
jgi:hypothetical protein